MDDFIEEKQISEGAYSHVLKVTRKADNQVYALKKVNIAQMNAKDRENAINEVRILASITHPNIVSYREAFVDAQSQMLCIVMTYADNGDLLQMIQERKTLQVYFKEKQVWRVLIECVHGLKSMHDISVMHRDIKCANIFLFKVIESTSKDLFMAKLGDMNVSKVTGPQGLNYT